MKLSFILPALFYLTTLMGTLAAPFPATNGERGIAGPKFVREVEAIVRCLRLWQAY